MPPKALAGSSLGDLPPVGNRTPPWRRRWWCAGGPARAFYTAPRW